MDVTELMLHQSIRVRDLAQDPKWKAMTDGETMIVHVVMPKAEEAAARRRRAEAAPAAAAEPEVIKKGKDEKEEEERRSRRRSVEIGCEFAYREADCWARQSRARIPGHAAQRRLHGRRRDRAAPRLTWAMAPSQVPDAFVAKQLRCRSAAARQAADVHEPQRRRGGRAGAVLRRRAGDLLIVVDEAALPFGRLRARAPGSAGGHNGLKSVIERLGTTEFPRLRLGVGRGDARRDLADHVLSNSSRPNEPARIVHHPGGRCRRDVRRGGHPQGDEHVQRGRRGVRQLNDSLPPASGRTPGQ